MLILTHPSFSGAQISPKHAAELETQLYSIKADESSLILMIIDWIKELHSNYYRHGISINKECGVRKLCISSVLGDGHVPEIPGPSHRQDSRGNSWSYPHGGIPSGFSR